MMPPFLEQLKFNEQGLIPAVVQDARTREVLMFAYMNREAVQKTWESGRATYWSRSRKQLWIKGETSGHVQKVVELRYDCDADCILLIVEQTGAACHTGFHNCFFTRIADGIGVVEGKPIVSM